MAKMGKFSVSGMKKFQQELNKIKQDDVEAFIAACAKELAARLLRKVIKLTPVGDYSGTSYSCAGGLTHKGNKIEGKDGGTLRRGWTAATHEEAASGKGKSSVSKGKSYANSLEINHTGNMLVIVIKNPVEYASYVEYGHRKVNGGWVKGHFMLTISEQEIQNIAPKVLESKIKKFLGECFQ